MKIHVVTAEAECCCALGTHGGPVELIGAFSAETDAEARKTDLLLHASKWGRTMLVTELDLDADKSAPGAQPAPVVEHGQLYAGGPILVRPLSWDDAYPLAEWIRHKSRHGGKVLRRTVIVVEDWAEVTE